MTALKLKAKVHKIAQANPKVMEAKAAFDAAWKAAGAAKSVLLEAIKATPEWRVMEESAGPPSLTFDRYGNSEIVARLRPDYEPSPDPLPPQTLNALLTGKLLSDEEKRNLLANHGVRLTKKDAPKASDADNLPIASDFDDEIPF